MWNPKNKINEQTKQNKTKTNRYREQSARVEVVGWGGGGVLSETGEEN